MMSLQTERHFIMQVVCEATQCNTTAVRSHDCQEDSAVCHVQAPPSSQVQGAALQCLVKIMSLYYQYMESYMGPALFAVSVTGVCGGVSGVTGVCGGVSSVTGGLR